MISLKIILPTPEKGLNAHNKGHWRAKAKLVKARREHARFLTLAAMRKAGVDGNWELAKVHYTFYVPDNVQRDRANLIQQEKPSIDGVVDAGLIIGDHWQVLELGRCNVVIRKAKPGTVLEFERLSS